jgi:sugar O-acyltransferase (sialic acid O-acetyltransferase NeuD family)
MRLAIYGAGGFGRELVAIAREQAPDADVIFVSDDPSQIGKTICGLPVMDAATLDRPAVLAMADASLRRMLADRIEPFSLVSRMHRRGPDVDVGEGAVFCDFTSVTASARIGRHFQCNVYSYIAHDCVIGDFVTFAPNVCCNGNVIIEDDVYVGTGVIIRQGRPDQPIRIGRGAVLGMGAVVTRSVEPGATVVGNPARPMKVSTEA